MLKLKDISITKKGKRILDNLSLTILPREIHSILGQNGTGKSTLAYTLMGLPDYQVNRGQTLWQGKNINKLSVTERAQFGITLAWQEPVRFEGLRVKEYLEIGARGNSRILTPEQSLERVGLNPD